MSYDKPGIERCCTICDQRENLVSMNRGPGLYPVSFCRSCADDVITWAKRQIRSDVARATFGD